MVASEPVGGRSRATELPCLLVAADIQYIPTCIVYTNIEKSYITGMPKQEVGLFKFCTLAYEMRYVGNYYIIVGVIIWKFYLFGNSV